MSSNQVVNLAAALSTFDETWDPRIVGTVNDYDVRVAHVQGEFTWHTHDDTDEFFLVVKGVLNIHLRDRIVTLHPGEMFVVPAGVEHKPVAVEPTDILMFEPAGTPNTGDSHEELPDYISTTTGKAMA